METADDAILSLIEQDLLNPEIVEAALTRASAILTVTDRQENVERLQEQRGAVQKQIRETDGGRREGG